MNSKCSVAHFTFNLSMIKLFWNRQMRLITKTGNYIVSVFWAAYSRFFFKFQNKGFFFFSSFSFGTGFYPGVLKYSSSCSFSIKVNVEEGKCGSRHLTSFVNEYLKLRNKWSWNLKKIKERMHANYQTRSPTCRILSNLCEVGKMKEVRIWNGRMKKRNKNEVKIRSNLESESTTLSNY